MPYDLSPQFVADLFTKHKIDYIIHGDDPCLLPDGTDAYEHAKKLGRFKMVRDMQLCRQPWRIDSLCCVCAPRVCTVSRWLAARHPPLPQALLMLPAPLC